MRVVVLMSTFNGEKYIVEQVESILSQLPLDGQLMVRDDGSNDSTVDLLKTFNDVRIGIQLGSNIGFGKSFLTLLANAPEDLDMLMFADQDDVWLPDKIHRAWEHLLLVRTQPALYCSAQMLVDARLHPLHSTPSWPCGPSFAGALSENIVTGCTAALNRPATLLLRNLGVPAGVHFHDWWLYLTVSAFGVVIVDEKPTLLYRQHSRNLIGHGSGWWGRNIQILRFLMRNDWVGIMLRQIGALHTCLGSQLPPQHKALLQRYFIISGMRTAPRWALILGPQRWRQTALQEGLFRVLLFLHKLHIWPLPKQRL